MRSFITILLIITIISVYCGRRSEYVEGPLSGRSHITTLTPSQYIKVNSLPLSFTWGNITGRSYLTKTLNQHLPQYCGSCWAHGALSALGDRIKIADPSVPSEINLSVQYILNCGSSAGSCYGGDAGAVYAFLQEGGHVPYDTCMPYSACSSDSSQGFCSNADWTCNALNTCRTCNTFSEDGGKCVGLTHYPNATVAQYGPVSGELSIMAEVYARGPIACGIYAQPLVDYKGGVASGPAEPIDHIISIVGWGEENNQKYWIVRNSWGQYWGEMGFFRVAKGNNDLNLESSCYWATPSTYSTTNFPCGEDGSSCLSSETPKGQYVDPSVDFIPYGARLSQKN